MISLIIPFYNCENTIDKTMEEINSFIKRYNGYIEFFLVDDGSTDSTFKKLKEYETANIKVLGYSNNRGKGGAIKEGVLNATGDKIIFTDADLAYGLDIISEFDEALLDSDLALGTRRLDESLDKSYGTLRSLASNIFSMIIERILKLGINDTQCGFKGYKKEVAIKLFSDLKIKGFGFDLEIIAKARKEKYEITQIPVTLLKNEKNSSVSLIGDGVRMLFDAYKIRKMVKGKKTL